MKWAEDRTTCGRKSHIYLQQNNRGSNGDFAVTRTEIMHHFQTDFNSLFTKYRNFILYYKLLHEQISLKNRILQGEPFNHLYININVQQIMKINKHIFRLLIDRCELFLVQFI